MVNLKESKLEEIYVSHLFFMDDISLFCDGFRWDVMKLKEILNLYFKGKCMMINAQKPFIPLSNLEEKVRFFFRLFHFHHTNLENGAQYLGFLLKPNDYGKKD